MTQALQVQIVKRLTGGAARSHDGAHALFTLDVAFDGAPPEAAQP